MEDPTEEGRFHRSLGPLGLLALGIGAIVGAGIFVLTGQAAAAYAGPAIIVSFGLAGLGCGFAGLCYAELAAMIPVAGSAYTYAYATMGELPAWIIGWDLILEYLIGAATVAVGWSGYLVSLLRDFGLSLPAELIAAPGTALIELPGKGWRVASPHVLTELAKQMSPKEVAALPHAMALLNLPAAFVALAVTVILVRGIHGTSLVNSVIVGVKLLVLLAFSLAAGAFLVRHPDVAGRNWTPFVPPSTGSFGAFGWSGILRGAGVIFFAYIGFDAVSTAAQEAKKPQRDMPIGILGSLLVCTILYVVVAGLLTALVPYPLLGVPDPIAVGIDATSATWLAPFVKLGALAGLTSVVLVLMLAQPRIFWAMARDGLLPAVFAKVHPRYRTPYVTTVATGLAVAAVAAVVPISILGELVSIGTLFAFTLVCIGTWILRRRAPGLERPFRAPFVPLVPLLGATICLIQMFCLPAATWVRLAIWMAIGLGIYFGYGIRRAHTGGAYKT